MPTLLRCLLGFILLVATIGLVTCESMLRAEPLYPASVLPEHAQAAP
ncbi:MAG: hypothetical protein ACXWF8_01060 [Methylobacter sp.]